LRLIRYIGIGSLDNLNFKAQINHDHRILGHLPYAEILKKKLVLIEPNIEVHIDMHDSLLKMRDQAKKDGIYLVFLSGYRSINLQNEIFYSLKSFRNQEAVERARVSAPQDILNIVLVLQLILVMLLSEKQTLSPNSKILTPLNG